MKNKNLYISVLLSAAALAVMVYANHAENSVAAITSPSSGSHPYHVIGAEPGVDSELSTMFNNRTEAMMVKTEAYVREVVSKPESLLDLSCNGGSIANFSNLGKIFSDLKGKFHFDLSGNPLCTALTTDFGADVTTDLSIFFKMPGISLPTVSICGPSFDVGAALSDMISGAVQAALGADINNLSAGKNAFGCSIKGGLSIKGSLTVSTPCATIALPSLSCNTSTKIFTNAVSGVLKNAAEAAGLGDFIGAKGNFGPLYMSLDKMSDMSVSASAGIDKNYEPENPKVKAFMKDAEKIKKFIDTFGGFKNGFSVSLGGTFSGSSGVSSRQASEDGLTSDGGFSVENGSALKSGSGEEFKEVISLGKNAEIFKAVKFDQDNLKEGPNKIVSWKEQPNFTASVDIADVLREIASSGSSSGGTTTPPATTP